MMLKYLNNLGLGFLLGLIGPGIGFCIYYLLKFRKYTFEQYCNMFMDMKELQSPLVSLSLVFNLLTFFLFIKLNKDKTSKGILLATMLYIPVVFFLRFFY